MFKKLKLLGVFMVVCQFISISYGCNERYLEQEAGAYVTKLWSSIPITQNMLLDSVGFLNDPKKVDHKYSDLNVFKGLSQASQDRLKDSPFLQFAQACEKLFEESADLSIQVATHILLERVYNKYFAELEKIEKIRARERVAQKTDVVKEPSAAFLEMFSHADKGVNVNLIDTH